MLTFCCFLATDNFCFIFQRLWTAFEQHFQAFSPGSAAPDWPDAKGPSYKDVRRCFTNIGLCRSTELASIFTVLKMFLDTFFGRYLGSPMTGARELCKAESRCFRVFCTFKNLVCMKLHRRRRNAHAEHGAGRVLDHQTRFFDRFFLKAPLLQTFPRPVAGRRRIKAS